MQRRKLAVISLIAAAILLLNPAVGFAQAGGAIPVGGERPSLHDLRPSDRERLRKLVDDLNRPEPESSTRFLSCLDLGLGKWRKFDGPTEPFDPNGLSDIGEPLEIPVPDDTKWRYEQTGTPITGDSTGAVDSWSTFYAMRDPFFNTPFPIPGIGLGVTFWSQGHAGQSAADWERHSFLTVVFEPLNFMFFCEMGPD